MAASYASHRPGTAGVAAVVVVATLAAGCDVGLHATSFGGGGDRPDGASAAGDAGRNAPTGLPCDVAALFQSQCDSCHGDPTQNSAPISLVTRADLMKASTVDPAVDLARRSLVRMVANQMPPGGGATAQQIATLQAWLSSGEPAGDCSPPGAAGDASPAADMAHALVDGGPPGSGLPCDVAQVLENRCASCHGNPPAGGALVTLLTRDDLLAAAYADPGVDYARRAVLRMNQQTMPPGGGASPSDIAVLQGWIDTGEPAGTCGAPGTDGGVMLDPLNVAPRCTSGRTSTTRESASMDAGEACISCHKQRGGPTFVAAGTVYPTGHEPDQCVGGAPPNTGVPTIVVTDARGVQHVMQVNAGGNFYLQVFGGIPLPYRAKVVWNGKERAMAAAQFDGDCNGCHTQSGSAGAPGRVTLPAP